VAVTQKGDYLPATQKMKYVQGLSEGEYMRNILIFSVLISVGVAVSYGLSRLAGLIWNELAFPVFVVLSLFWIWTGWKYVGLRDANRKAVHPENR